MFKNWLFLASTSLFPNILFSKLIVLVISENSKMKLVTSIKWLNTIHLVYLLVGHIVNVYIISGYHFIYFEGLQQKFYLNFHFWVWHWWKFCLVSIEKKRTKLHFLEIDFVNKLTWQKYFISSIHFILVIGFFPRVSNKVFNISCCHFLDRLSIASYTAIE